MNLLAISSGGLLTGTGFDGLAATSRGEITMVTIPVPPAPTWTELARSGAPMPDRKKRRTQADDDDEVLMVLAAIWEILQ